MRSTDGLIYGFSTRDVGMPLTHYFHKDRENKGIANIFDFFCKMCIGVFNYQRLPYLVGNIMNALITIPLFLHNPIGIMQRLSFHSM